LNKRASSKEKMGLVVLNACYSENQAQNISKSVDCVIGISGAIEASSATAFAGRFYEVSRSTSRYRHRVSAWAYSN
jgi:hypothetical protein